MDCTLGWSVDEATTYVRCIILFPLSTFARAVNIMIDDTHSILLLPDLWTSLDIFGRLVCAQILVYDHLD